MSSNQAIKPLLDQPCPSFLLLCHCARMPAKGVAYKAVAKAKAKALALTDQTASGTPVSVLACPFRNLMKYRASDSCKKAFSVTMHP